MATPASTNQTWRFGVYEVDARRVELRRDGFPVKLREQSFLILIYLLENAGEIVRREELQRILWPSDTYVDFYYGLNMAMKGLRDTLGDSSDAPLFIETIPKRGYRFIAPVTPVDGRFADPPELPVEMPGKLAPADPAMLGNNVAEKEVPARKPGAGASTLRWPWLVAAAVLILGLVSTFWYIGRPPPPPRVTEYTQITHDSHHKSLVGTDGIRLYLNRWPEPEPLAQAPIAGGKMESLPVALPGARMLDLSPDGSSLLVRSNDGAKWSLWSVRIPGGSLRHLIDADISSGAWSTDGKQVVYSTLKGEIYLIKSDGTEAHRLVSLAATPVETRNLAPENFNWSADGSKIRFDDGRRLFEVSANGSGLHLLLPGFRPSSLQCCGRWTPDGSFFVFLLRDPYYAFGSSFPTGASQMWALDERRSLFRRNAIGPFPLTSGPTRWGSSIPSKDGKTIYARGVTELGELVRYDGKSRQIQPYLAGTSAEFVAFAPDGNSLAYVTFPEGILWRANRDGSNPIQLTDPPLYPTSLRWSPDGSQILFCAVDTEGIAKSYLIPFQGGAPRPILLGDEEQQSDANWSPDGGKIVFSSSGAGWFSTHPVEKILDLASRQLSTLPGSEGTRSPRWSPDGRHIAAMFGNNGLKVFDLETQRWTELQKAQTGFPTWSRDGQFIYFLRLGDDPGVFRIRPSGGKVERVVDLKGFHHTGLFWGLDGARSGGRSTVAARRGNGRHLRPHAGNEVTWSGCIQVLNLRTVRSRARCARVTARPPWRPTSKTKGSARRTG